MNKDFSPTTWYEQMYSKVNVSADPDSLAFRFLHSSIEKNVPPGEYAKILEVGADQGQHISFVTQNWDSYTAIDLHLPRKEVSKHFKNLRVLFQKGNVNSLDFIDNSFDRTIVTCVLHHVVDIEKAFREILRVTRVGGVISIAVPNDPGLTYRFLRSLSSVRRARKLGLEDELELVHAFEHRNHYLAINSILKWVFSGHQVTSKSYPGFFRFWQFNFLTVHTIIKDQ
jgi:ubiquinone/menaquinone biosynthesis C-methylase UbiE